MSEQKHLPLLMSTLSAKANHLVRELSWLREQNTSLLKENSVLLKRQDELITRVSSLESEVSKHKATEEELEQSIQHISDAFSTVDVRAKNAADKSASLGPSTRQTTFLNQGSVDKSISMQASTNSKADQSASTGGKISDPSSLFTTSAFGGNTGTFSSLGFASMFGAQTSGFGMPGPGPFKTATSNEKFDLSKFTQQNTGFGATTTAANQQGFFKVPEQSTVQKASESASNAKKPSLFGSETVTNQPSVFASAFGQTSPGKDAVQNTSQSSDPGKKPNLFSTSFDKTDSKPLTQTTSNSGGFGGFTTTANNPYMVSTASSVFSAKTEAPTEATSTSTLFSSFGEKGQGNVSGVFGAAVDPIPANSSSAPIDGKGTSVHNTDKEKEPEDQKKVDFSDLFPSPTPLSRSTFQSVLTSQTEAQREQARISPDKRPPSSLIPPPRSTSFSYQISRVNGEKYVTISLMPFFDAYSAEEVRLWDYVNGEKFRTF